MYEYKRRWSKVAYGIILLCSAPIPIYVILPLFEFGENDDVFNGVIDFIYSLASFRMDTSLVDETFMDSITLLLYALAVIMFIYGVYFICVGAQLHEIKIDENKRR